MVLRRVDVPFHEEEEEVDVDRLAQEVGRPLLHRDDGRLHGSVAGEQDDRKRGVARERGVEDGEAVGPGELQVGQDEGVAPPLGETPDRLVAGRDRLDAVPLAGRASRRASTGATPGPRRGGSRRPSRPGKSPRSGAAAGRLRLVGRRLWHVGPARRRRRADRSVRRTGAAQPGGGGAGVGSGAGVGGGGGGTSLPSPPPSPVVAPAWPAGSRELFSPSFGAGARTFHRGT